MITVPLTALDTTTNNTDNSNNNNNNTKTTTLLPGACYYDSGDIPRAIASFKHAIQLEPNFPDCLVNMGNALREDSRLDEALQCYRTALQLKPGNL